MKAGTGGLVAFLSVFYLLGFGVLGYALKRARRSSQAKTWPTTRGLVMDLELKEHSGSDEVLLRNLVVQ